ncbi:MAG: hypothetical protein ACI87H_000768, partial [Gammaproteobacteria bacterium]
NHRNLELRWTRRAQHQLEQLDAKLTIELQLYFSCVVKKRVLFHRQVDYPATSVNDKLALVFRPIASSACDPQILARDFPEGKDLSAGPASKMVPKRVEFDFRGGHFGAGHWSGQFNC